MLEFKSNKLIDFSYKLSRLHRTALPNAVRFTLNDSAKDMKFRTIKKHAAKQFDVKKRSFFSKFSGYQSVKKGVWNISKMYTIAGMIKDPNNKSIASTEIKEQQYAGLLENKTYMPSSGSYGKQRTSRGLVKSSYLNERKKTPIKAEKGNKFFLNARKAKESNRPLLIRKNNKGILVKVNRIRKVKGVKFKKEVITTPIASYRKEGKLNLKKARPFINDAAIESGKLLNINFQKHAKQQIDRFTK